MHHLIVASLTVSGNYSVLRTQYRLIGICSTTGSAALQHDVSRGVSLLLAHAAKLLQCSEATSVSAPDELLLVTYRSTNAINRACEALWGVRGLPWGWWTPCLLELELSGCFTRQRRWPLPEEAAAVTTATAAGICSGCFASEPLVALRCRYVEQQRAGCT